MSLSNELPNPKDVNELINNLKQAYLQTTDPIISMKIEKLIKYITVGRLVNLNQLPKRS